MVKLLEQTVDSKESVSVFYNATVIITDFLPVTDISTKLYNIFIKGTKMYVNI